MFKTKIAENEIHVAVIQFPSGKFGFAGFRIPGELMYEDDAEKVAKMVAASCRQFLTTRAFESEAAAETAIADWPAAHTGYSYTCTKGGNNFDFLLTFCAEPVE